jgi:hypothetical protein
MPILAAFALSNLKHDLGAIWTWICHRSFWQLAFGAVAIFALIQHFTIAGERRHSAKVEAQLKVATDQLKSLSTAKNEQKVETVKRIEAVKERVRHADDRAKVIEQAPLPGQCKTPSEVLQADL